jgi:hypothetical protein
MIANVRGHAPLRVALFVLAICLAFTRMPPAAAQLVTVLSGSVSFSGSLTVQIGQILRFDPNAHTTVEITGNLVVLGTLEMKPAPGIQHTLKFVGVNESAFVGGGTKVLESDRGLWVMGSGRLDLVGDTKAGWNRTGSDPTWKATDELKVAPTALGDYGGQGFASFAMGSPVPQADPSVPKAEVINLTRSVHIQGTPSGRSHVFILSTVPQTIRYVEFRYLGPRQPAEDGTVGVMGRYPLHFHLAGDGSRGSIVEGNVVRDSGNRAIVPHASHGITVRDNVAYDVFDIPYWWDENDISHDSTWEHNFAGFVRVDPPYRGFDNSGFLLGLGERNVSINNAAAGIQGNKQCSGFIWPSSPSGLWGFSGNVAHNNNCSGIFVWQNDDTPHFITDFIAYRNKVAGIDHGAYNNGYIYTNLYLFQNGVAGIINHTFSKGVKPGQSRQTWSCVTVVGSPVGVLLEKSNVDEGLPILFQNLVGKDTGQLVQVSPEALAAGQTLNVRAELVNTGIPCGSSGASAVSVGLVDSGAQWHLYEQLAQSATITRFYYGNPGDVALMGDWNCDGEDSPAMYRPSNGFMYLRNSNTQGVADISYFYGNPSDIPIAGDFNGDNCDTLAIYRPSEGKVYVKDSLGTGVADYSYYFGNPGDQPFTGDFNGDGTDTVGLYRQSAGSVYFRNSNTQGVADFDYFYGNPGDKMLTGDWDLNGTDTLAVYRPSDGKLYVRFTNTQGVADLTLTVGFFKTALTFGRR